MFHRQRRTARFEARKIGDRRLFGVPLYYVYDHARGTSSSMEEPYVSTRRTAKAKARTLNRRFSAWSNPN